MGQWYDVGLQAGKIVANAIDAFIASEHKGDNPGENFDPCTRKEISDGSIVYRWQMKWDPYWFEDEGRFVEVLDKFSDANLPDEDEIEALGLEYDDYAYKLVAVGDEGGQDELCNEIGADIFDGLYNACEVTFPDEFCEPKTVKVYVYKEYNDDNAYGEELIEVYQSKDKAVARLRERVESAYKLPWDEIPREYGFDDRDTFEEDYVSIDDGQSCSFWIVEEKHVV